MSRLTVAEIAVFLGITAAGVRSLIRNHGIAPTGKRGRANEYDARAVVDTLGPHDRRFTRKRRRDMAH
jgi:hypothetical protein